MKNKNTIWFIVGFIALLIFSGLLSDFYPSWLKGQNGSMNLSMDSIAYTISRFFGTEDMWLGYLVLIIAIVYVLYLITNRRK